MPAQSSTLVAPASGNNPLVLALCFALMFAATAFVHLAPYAIVDGLL